MVGAWGFEARAILRKVFWGNFPAFCRGAVIYLAYFCALVPYILMCTPGPPSPPPASSRHILPAHNLLTHNTSLTYTHVLRTEFRIGEVDCILHAKQQHYQEGFRMFEARHNSTEARHEETPHVTTSYAIVHRCALRKFQRNETKGIASLDHQRCCATSRCIT